MNLGVRTMSFHIQILDDVFVRLEIPKMVQERK
jgi:hypothetical protein